MPWLFFLLYCCRPKRENTKTRPAKFKNIPRKKPTDENSPRRTHQKKGKPRFLFASFPAKHTANLSARVDIVRGKVIRVEVFA